MKDSIFNMRANCDRSIDLIIKAYESILALFKDNEAVKELQKNGRVAFDSGETARTFMNLYYDAYGDGMYCEEYSDGTVMVYLCN